MNTPYYIIEESKLRNNLQLIHDVAEKADCQIILAFKAYALWRTFPIIREYINATTASSPWEARLALEEFGARAHTFSPAYEDETFTEILRSSSHVIFNSASQYSHFISQVEQWNCNNPMQRVSVGIRINPEHSHIETDLYNPTAPGSRFGLLEQQILELYQDKGGIFPSQIEGFHCHCHCESSAEDLVDNLRYIEQHFSRWFSQIKWLNLGGGHLMTRKGYNTNLLISTIHGLHKRYPNLQIILEPGSAFGWQTGPLVASIVDIVENKGIKTAILNVSFTCHMPDCLEMPYKPSLEEEDENGEYVYRLGGNSCLSGDFIEGFRFKEPLRIGQTLHFQDMNHYTTVKTTMFNGIRHPKLAIRHTDGTVKILREYTYEDYRDRMD